MRVINVTPKMDALLLGKQGENKSTKFLFDVSGWLEDYPGCTITLVHRRPHESSSYPCVLTTEEDGRRSWVINSADLAKDGDGQAELKCTLGDVIEKDKRTWKTKIGKSLSGDGDAPEPWESLMDDIEDMVGDAQDAAEDAEDAKEAAEEAASIAAHAPIIQDGYWYTWDATTEQYVNSGEKAQGDDATPALITVDYSELTFPVAEGKLCYHSGLLYKANQAIATREEWTAAHWTQTTIEAEQHALLTEINSAEEDVDEVKSIINALPFTDDTEGIPLTWDLINKYRISDGSYIDKSWAYESRTSVTPGEKYYVTGYSYYEMCIYYVEDSNGDIIAEVHFSNTDSLHENMKVTIPANGETLVLQVNNADRRTASELKKVVGEILSDETVGYSNLKNEVRSLMIPPGGIINLYNDQDPDIVTGKYIGSDGSFTTSSSMQVSGFIPVEYGKTYSFPAYTNYFGESSPKYVNAYYENKTRAWALTGTVDTSAKITTFTVNDSTLKYVRVNVASLGSSAAISPHLNGECFMFTESPFPQKYYPYGVLVDFDSNVYLDADKEQSLNPLFRKSVVFTGDSICNGASANDNKSGWAGRIGRKNEMMWINKGISGATLTAGITGSYGVISETTFDNADYIIIEGGTNDADLIGDARTTTPAKFGSYTPGDYESTFTNTTFCGAIEYLFKKLANDYKDKKVGVIIAQKMGQLNASIADYTKEHNNRRLYFETLINLCEKWGVPYLNLWDHSIFNPMMPNQYTYQQASSEGKFYVDGQHLTADGYDAISTIIERWMKTL